MPIGKFPMIADAKVVEPSKGPYCVTTDAPLLCSFIQMSFACHNIIFRNIYINIILKIIYDGDDDDDGKSKVKKAEHWMPIVDLY